MKRSEMISKLSEFHDDNINMIGRGVSVIDYYDMLLDLIESEGMLPPLSKNRIELPDEHTQEYYEAKAYVWEEE